MTECMAVGPGGGGGACFIINFLLKKIKQTKFPTVLASKKGGGTVVVL